MPAYAVNTAFTANDRLTPAFKKMGSQARNTGSIFKGVFAANIVHSGLFKLTQGLMTAGREFMAYDQAITASSAKFKDLNMATEEGQKRLIELKKVAREVGAVTSFSATEAAQGLDFLAMAGFTSSQAMAALMPMTKLAKVANTDLARATDIASDSLGAFGLMTQDATQLTTNFNRVNDVFAKTMTTSNTNMEDLFEAVKKGAPTFTAASQSLESFAAMSGLMANSGVKGAEAGTMLRNVMLRLADPTAEASSALSGLGVITQDSSGNFRDVLDIMADMEKGLKGMGTAQQAAALSTIFGARAVTGVQVLLQNGSTTIKNYRNELLAAGGASDTMAGIVEGSLANKLKILQSTLLEVGFKFIDVFEKKGGTALNDLTKMIQNFNVEPIVNALSIAGNALMGIFKVLKFISPLIGPIVVGLIAMKGAMAVAWIYNAITAIQKLVAVKGLWVVVQNALNLAFWLSPIGLVILAVGALAAGAYLLIKNWQKVKDFFIGLWDWIKGKWSFFTALLGFGGGDVNVEEKKEMITRQAPNEAANSRQSVNVGGEVVFKNAPAGTEVKNTGAREIDFALAGANP